MRLKVWFFFVLTSMVLSNLQAQQSTVFTVIDNEGFPLIGATATVGEFGEVTDIDGKTTLQVRSGDEVIFSYVGYENVSFRVPDPIPSEHQITLLESVTLLQTATVTASRYERPLAESTVSIDVLSAEFIERNGAPEIEDALNRMPGVQIIDGQANIRGGSGWSYGAGSRVMLLMDDMPLLQVDAATTNWGDLPMENVGAIEIVKGASSALYGSSALNGVIHFRTNYAKGEPETEIAVQSTLYEMPNDSTDYNTAHNSLISLVHRRKIQKWDLVFGGFYRNEESWRQDMYAKFGRFSSQVRYRFSDRLVAGVNGMVVPGTSRDYFYWDAPNSYRGNPTGFNQNSRLRYNIDPYVKLDHGKWTHKWQGRLYYIDNQNDDQQGNQSDMLYGEYQAQYRNPETGLGMAGGLVHTYTRSISELYSDTTFHNYNSALYFQLEKSVTERWQLSAGVRWERNELRSPEFIFGDTIPDGKSIESQPIFRFGTNYRMGKATYLRASFGQGYRFPSIAEKFISTTAGGLDIRPNPSLESEQGWTAEFGVRQGLAGSHWNGYFDLSLFRSEYQSMMEFGAALTGREIFFISRNVGGVRIDGVEANGFFEYVDGKMKFNTQFGVTYINPRFLDWDENGLGQPPNGSDLSIAEVNAANSTASDDVLKYRNKFNFKLDAQFSYSGWFIGANVSRTSPMLAVDRVLAFLIPGLEEDGQYLLDESQSLLLDLRTGYEWEGCKIQLMAKNLGNVRYWSRPGFLEAPRNYTIRLDVKF